jgi:hypothetical protein
VKEGSKEPGVRVTLIKKTKEGLLRIDLEESHFYETVPKI